MADNTFYTDVSERGGKIFLRYVENGVHKKEVIEYEPELYIKTNDEAKRCSKSMWDESLEKIIFTDKKAMNQFIENYKQVDGFSVYGMDKIGYQFIAKTFPGNLNVDTQYIRGAYIDIETYSGTMDADGNPIDGPFPQPETADYPISMLTMYTTHDKTYHVWATEEFNGRKLGTYKHDKSHPRVGHLNVVYHGFTNEYDMLCDFVNHFSRAEINYWSGWYIEGFDNPYMTNRIEKVCGETIKKKLSPWNIVIKDSIKNSWGGEDTVFDWMGCSMLDYKALFGKHAFMNPDNLKLETVAQMILGEGKVDYKDEGNLNTLYIRNFQKAVEYNVVDVDLVVGINNKMQLIDLTFTLAYLTKSNYQDTLATVKPWSSLSYSMLYDMNIQPKLKSIYQGDTSFAGGFVRDVTPGKRRWVVSCDLNSLYPHLIQQYNLGTETLIEPEDLPAEIRNMPYFTMDDLVNKRVDLSVLKKYNICMTANRQFFRRDKTSIFNTKTREIYNQRKDVKKEMLRIKQMKVDLEALMEKHGTPDQEAALDEFKRIIKSKDNLQHSLKILMNSLFGALGNKYFKEYFDIRVAEGITLSGQLSVIWVARKLDEYFNKLFKLGNVRYKVTHVSKPKPATTLEVLEGTNFAFYQDTDSCYLDMSMLVDKMFTKEQQENEVEKIVNFLDKLFNEKIEPFINSAYEELAEYMNAFEQRMFMKREVIATAAIWAAKKRYTMLVADSEGVRYWPNMDHKTTGLDAVKASYPRLCRDWMMEGYLIALKGTEDEIHTLVSEKREEYKKLAVAKIATPTGVNGLEKYIDANTVYVKGTPKQVKASLWHNHLIRKKGITGIPFIQSGDKILHVELKTPNPVGTDVIGFQGTLPEEFGLTKYVDYDSGFDKNFIDPLNNLIGVLNWNPEKVASASDWFS